MPAEDLARLGAIVLGDPAAQAQLVAVTDPEAFIAATIALARTHGLDVQDADLQAAFTAGERRLIERAV